MIRMFFYIMLLSSTLVLAQQDTNSILLQDMLNYLNSHPLNDQSGETVKVFQDAINQATRNQPSTASLSPVSAPADIPVALAAGVPASVAAAAAVPAAFIPPAVIVPGTANLASSRPNVPAPVGDIAVVAPVVVAAPEPNTEAAAVEPNANVAAAVEPNANVAAAVEPNANVAAAVEPNANVAAVAEPNAVNPPIVANTEAAKSNVESTNIAAVPEAVPVLAADTAARVPAPVIAVDTTPSDVTLDTTNQVAPVIPAAGPDVLQNNVPISEAAISAVTSVQVTAVPTVAPTATVVPVPTVTGPPTSGISVITTASLSVTRTSIMSSVSSARTSTASATTTIPPMSAGVSLFDDHHYLVGMMSVLTVLSMFYHV